MDRYPLISRVIFLQVLINLIGLLFIVATGFSLLKSIESKRAQEYRDSLKQIIEPKYQTFISWHLLGMSVLDEELNDLQNKYDLRSVHIRTAAETKHFENTGSTLIFPDPTLKPASTPDYFVIAEFNEEHLHILSLPIHWYLIFGAIILLSSLIIFQFYRSIRAQLFTAMNCIDQAIESIQSGLNPDFSYVSQKNEFSRFLTGVNVLYTSTKDIEHSKSILSVTKQVSHDIRSPLSALNIVVASLQEAPEEKRLIIREAVQRINAVANDLLIKAKKLESTSSSISSKAKKSQTSITENVDIPAVVGSLVKEKQIQFPEYSGIQFQIKSTLEKKMVALANSMDLKRVLSNLINNSIEALPNKDGCVCISIASSGENVIEISIRDTGCGIEPDIVQKLGLAPFSAGKENLSESGNGLGVYHAIKTIKLWGGNLEISSQPGYGSEFKITLPLVGTSES